MNKQTEILINIFKKKESHNIIKESELNKLKNDIIEKEGQIHRCKDHLNTLNGYKSFIKQIFRYSGQEPELCKLQGFENLFLHKFNILLLDFNLNLLLFLFLKKILKVKLDQKLIKKFIIIINIK